MPDTEFADWAERSVETSGLSRCRVDLAERLRLVDEELARREALRLIAARFDDSLINWDEAFKEES